MLLVLSGCDERLSEERRGCGEAVARHCYRDVISIDILSSIVGRAQTVEALLRMSYPYGAQ